jgi:hypothetical protein
MCKSKGKIVLMAIFFLCFAGFLSDVHSATIERKTKPEGYYREDGLYIQPVIIDIIDEKKDSAAPKLSNKIKARRKELSRFFEGKIITAKIALPACYRGIILYQDDLGKSNVGIFKRVNKYGVALEKGDKAIITKFRIKKKVIDIEINNGGYGNPEDLFLRGAAGIFSLGITEFTGCFSKVRYERGTRIRVKFKSKLQIKQLDLEKIKEYLLPVLELTS